MRESCVFLWSDRALFIGPRSETALHSHHAVEICVALDGSIDMASGNADGNGARAKNGRSADHPPIALVEQPGAMVAPDTEHRLTIWGPRVAILYVDPICADGKALRKRIADPFIQPIPKDLAHAWRPGYIDLLADAGLPRAKAMCDRVLDALLGSETRAEAARAHEKAIDTLDPRVARAREVIAENLDRVVSVGELAKEVGLSAGRMRHLFRDQVGVPVRRYALWMRLRHALSQALRGQPMTEAAHDAGFSDAAHFTRTCRQMFGLAPTNFAPVEILVADDA